MLSVGTAPETYSILALLYLIFTWGTRGILQNAERWMQNAERQMTLKFSDRG